MEGGQKEGREGGGVGGREGGRKEGGRGKRELKRGTCNIILILFSPLSLPSVSEVSLLMLPIHLFLYVNDILIYTISEGVEEGRRRKGGE